MRCEARLSRTAALLGEPAMERLKNACVMLVGLGGVGGHALDALVRSGVGHLVLVDYDTVDVTNLNRQLLADTTTVGRKKTAVAAERAALISKDVNITLHDERVTEENAEPLLRAETPTLVLDACDDVAAKVALAVAADRLGIPLISCLGTGNRLDPSALTVTDVAKTEGCPLARSFRTRLRRAGIRHLPVVFSREPARTPLTADVRVASSAFPPAAAGLLLASYAVRHIADL
ncbi:MAG: ThiF family adenylyltransferase [Clostridia bacterium]|nr:ThiF family adenylyltransferase [Clostridia bacterium]